MKAPKLIGVNLGGSDIRPFNQTPYLHVSGYIANLHERPAYESVIHVVAYQEQTLLAFDTYINLGTIGGESYTPVDASVQYNGSRLTSWGFTLDWSAVQPP